MIGLLRSEITKTLTTRTWWGLLIGAVLLTALQAVATAAVAGQAPGMGSPGTPDLDAPETLRQAFAGAAFNGTYLFALVIGVLAITGEYRHQTVTPTFLATPRRSRVIVAKALAQVAVGGVFGVVGVLAALVGAGIVIAVRGGSMGLDDGSLWRAMVLVVLAIALWTVLGLGLGTLLRNQIAAVLVAIGLGVVVEPIVGLVLNLLDLGAVAKFLPSAASSAVLDPDVAGVELLPWWAGALVMVGYAVVVGALGVLLSVRRDIT